MYRRAVVVVSCEARVRHKLGSWWEVYLRANVVASRAAMGYHLICFRRWCIDVPQTSLTVFPGGCSATSLVLGGRCIDVRLSSIAVFPVGATSLVLDGRGIVMLLFIVAGGVTSFVLGGRCIAVLMSSLVAFTGGVTRFVSSWWTMYHSAALVARRVSMWRHKLVSRRAI